MKNNEKQEVTYQAYRAFQDHLRRASSAAVSFRLVPKMATEEKSVNFNFKQERLVFRSKNAPLAKFRDSLLIENFKVDQLVQTFPFFSIFLTGAVSKLRKEVYFSWRYIILPKIEVIVENVMVAKINEKLRFEISSNPCLI